MKILQAPRTPKTPKITFVGANCGSPVHPVPALAEAPFIKKADQHPPRHLRPYITILLILFSFSLFAQTITQQSFENTPTDTWAYTANPSGTVPYFWGRTNQPMGGANAQNGTWHLCCTTPKSCFRNQTARYPCPA